MGWGFTGETGAAAKQASQKQNLNLSAHIIVKPYWCYGVALVQKPRPSRSVGEGRGSTSRVPFRHDTASVVGLFFLPASSKRERVV